MAEECPRKAFNLVSHLVACGEELKRGKDFADEASVEASLARTMAHELFEEGCITEEKYHEIEEELEEVSFLSTMRRIGKARDKYEPIKEKIEEADLREMARKWLEE